VKFLSCGVCVLSVMALGCAADSGSVPEPMPTEPEESQIEYSGCEPLSGVYRVSYAKQSGDCADLPEQLARFTDRSNSSALAPSCIGSITNSEDACDREEDATCPVTDDYGASVGQARLTTTFTQASATKLEGTATIALTTLGGPGCTATYAVSGTKIQ
jgi:hypothetical protein